MMNILEKIKDECDKRNGSCFIKEDWCEFFPLCSRSMPMFWSDNNIEEIEKRLADGNFRQKTN